MCIVTQIIKCILGLVVGIVLTIGLLCMAVGGILLWGMNSIMPKIYNLTGYLKDLLVNIGIKDDGIKEVEALIATNSATIGAVVFSIGAVLTAIAILGYLSLCCFSAKCFLVLIIIIINIILLGLLVIAIMYGIGGNQKIFEQIETGLNLLIKDYVAYNATNVQSLIINVVQTQLHCCGLYNYTDFENSPKWIGRNGTFKFPLSCCESKDMRYVDINQCMKTWKSSSLEKGCYSSIKPVLEKIVSYAFAGLGTGIAILALLDFLLILYVYCGSKSEKVEGR